MKRKSLKRCIKSTVPVTQVENRIAFAYWMCKALPTLIVRRNAIPDGTMAFDDNASSLTSLGFNHMFYAFIFLSVSFPCSAHLRDKDADFCEDPYREDNHPRGGAI